MEDGLPLSGASKKACCHRQQAQHKSISPADRKERNLCATVTFCVSPVPA